MQQPSLPAVERVLLGPGPSVIPPRVMRAMAAPVLSHLDPDFMLLLDDVRARLARLFNAPDGSLTIATSGTGTSGMEAIVANLVGEGTRVLVVTTGYFGDRLAEMCRRYGADVRKVEGEWGRAIDPQAVKAALARVQEREPDGSRRGGLVWHTQGSGKSLTMVMLAKALALSPAIRNPRLILVTDRLELDRQIGDTVRD